MRSSDRVKHKVRPGEPYSSPNQIGVVARVTPSSKNIPAMAYVSWSDDKHGDFQTWERQSDLIIVS